MLLAKENSRFRYSKKWENPDFSTTPLFFLTRWFRRLESHGGQGKAGRRPAAFFHMRGERTMPELPEVETLCRQLKALLPGEEILRIEILDARLGKIEGLVGRRVEDVKRRGKLLQICISGGLTAELHLRMSGRLFWQKGGVPVFAYSRLVIDFPAGTLILIDPRRFATFT